MLYYDRISDRIDINKTSASRNCDIFYYWKFLDKDLSFNKMSAMSVIMF